MDLGSINEKLLQNVQRAQLEQVALISKTLGLKPGSEFLAKAQEVSQATPAERAEIVKSIDTTLAQLNKNSAAPATKALINQLIEQKTLLQNSDIKLVNLNINPQSLGSSALTTNSPATTLLAYTDQPIQAGQALLLQFTETSGVRIVQPLSQNQLNAILIILRSKGIDLAQMDAKATNAPQAKELALQIAKMDLSKLFASNETSVQRPQISEAARAAISETLRNLLPQKDSGQDVLSSLPKITQFIQQIPVAQRKEWLSSSIQGALKTLANQIRTSDQLTNPKLLAVSLANNGQSFEHKLAQLLNPSAQPVTKSQMASPNNPQAATPISKIVTQDLKGALLGLAQQLAVEINKTPTLLSADASRNSLAIALPQLLGMFTAKMSGDKQAGELNQKQMRTQLIQLLHQYTMGSLAKIQLQQIHSLNNQLSQADVAQPNQSWQFELPIAYRHEVHPLQIHMEQKWIEEEHDEHEKQTNRVRQWTVMLNFDLPVIGKFYAQLAIVNENMSAKFWAERESTLADAKQKLNLLTQQLESQGINIVQLQFFPGSPPRPKMMLGYSLVDVKT